MRYMHGASSVAKSILYNINHIDVIRLKSSNLLSVPQYTIVYIRKSDNICHCVQRALANMFTRWRAVLFHMFRMCLVSVCSTCVSLSAQ